MTETRELTLYDQKFSGDVKDRPPLSWRRIPPTPYRAVNFVGGPDDSVEIFKGRSGGDALTNANRWLGQFGLSPVPDESTFASIDILGLPSLLVEAKGTYNPGMGGEPKEGYALVGAISEKSGEVATIKMVGPAEAVEGMRDEFIAYCESLEKVDVHFIEDEESETPES